jgi:hypothetical protein
LYNWREVIYNLSALSQKYLATTIKTSKPARIPKTNPIIDKTNNN